MNKPYIIGLTGGIGSGKTTVCNYFRQLGVPIIDADVISRQITSGKNPVIKKIEGLFGPEILDEDGEIDRALLRKAVFTEPEKKKLLESLIHPLVYTEIDKQLSTIAYPYCIVSVPLLVEHVNARKYNRILLVDSNIEDQVNRVMERDGLTMEEVMSIIANQVTRDERKSVADDILFNNGRLDLIKSRVFELHQKYLEEAKTLK